ncbi:ATP-grasp domain-containing protein [Hippea alviniae]|uniref:ATP-grasp domain-containing protein n=1 Tax=Hippea alviniae TaxID=1279027 RepID=UPI0003B70B40|nr:hypothetical protein [Hippea alviniae]
MISQKDIIVSVGAGKNQIPLIKEIRKQGYKCLSFDRNKNAEGFLISDYYAPISSYDFRSIIEYIEKNGFADRLAGVLTRSTGMPVYSTAMIAKHFNLKYITPEIAKLLTDKSLLIRKLNELNIPSPKLIISDGSIPDDVEFPVFVKPSKTIKSHAGMSLCFNEFELKEAIAKAVAVSDNGKANIEEYLTGYDIVSIDFVNNGKIFHVCYLGELNKGKPDFVGAGWYIPPEDFTFAVKKTVHKFVEELSIKNGFFQIATKVSKDFQHAKIYEIHGEIGGDYTSDVFIPSCFDGYNLFKENINFVLGKPLEKTKLKKKCAIIFDCNQKGRYEIACFKGWKELLKFVGTKRQEGIYFCNDD